MSFCALCKFIYCRHKTSIGAGESCFAYIISWSKGKEPDELKSSLDCICSTAGKIIDDIESNIPELAQRKEKPKTQEKCVSR